MVKYLTSPRGHAPLSYQSHGVQDLGVLEYEYKSVSAFRQFLVTIENKRFKKQNKTKTIRSLTCCFRSCEKRY